MSNDLAELEHKIEVLHRHCDAVGRDPRDIRKTCGGLATLDPFENLDEYLRTAERFGRLGIDMINVGPLPGNPDPVGYIRRLGDEVIPRLAEIG